MSAEACSMAHLVEAKHDGRLGVRDNASLARHLAACASCRDLERALDEVRARLRADTGGRATPLEHQRGRLALLRAAAAPAPSSGRFARARAARVAAAACVSVGALVAASSLLRAREGARVPLAQRLPAASLQWPERTETTIKGSPLARFRRHTDGPLERIELAEGTLDLSVRKLAPGERFVVATADAEVEVRGTVFEVEAHDGRLASVSVTEGKVEILHEGARSLLARGGSWRPPEVGEPVPEPSLAPASTAAPASTVALTPTGRVAGTPHAAAAPAANEDAASKAFAAAVAKLASGNYGEASERLAEFRKAHPGDARAEDAAFLAIVSLQRAGKNTDAKNAARRYLAAYPNGDRRAEAEKAAR